MISTRRHGSYNCLILDIILASRLHEAELHDRMRVESLPVKSGDADIC